MEQKISKDTILKDCMNQILRSVVLLLVDFGWLSVANDGISVACGKNAGKFVEIYRCFDRRTGVP